MKIRYILAKENTDVSHIAVKKFVGGSAEIEVYSTPDRLAKVFSSYEALHAFVGELEDLVDESIKFHRYAWPNDEWKENEK